MKIRRKKEEGRSKTGQALVELAVFGTIFLMILGALVSYGLKFGFQQQAQQEAFRRALAIAANTNDNTKSVGVSYMLMRDRHIPDPLETFGIGASAPISASASVTRTNNLDAMADNYASLPTTVMDIETDRLHTASATPTTSMRKVLKTGGFRVEYDVAKDDNALQKYGLIVGSVDFRRGSGWTSGSSSADAGCPGGWTTTTNPGTGATTTTCSGTESYAAIKILDACAGETIDYGSCYKQAVLLVDTSRCTTYCQTTRTESSSYNCSSICGAQTNPPNQYDNSYDPAKGGAWYAADWTYDSATGRYTFPALDQLFSFSGAGVKTMGMQPNATTTSTRDTSFEKIETASQIQTDERFDWSETTDKTFVTHPNLNTGTGQESATDITALTSATQEAITTQVSGTGRAAWTTDK